MTQHNSIWKDKMGNSKIPLAKSKLFWIGLALKIIVSICFASDYMRDLFAPFAKYFIETGFNDPYQFFYLEGNGNEFPYPPLMLWLFSIPRMIVWPLFPGSAFEFTVLDSFLFRVPLLIADFAILLVLMSWLKNKTRQVLIWYWLSPVLIYINYFHGQLDVIPMAMLMISLYFLFKHKWLMAFLFIGFAVSTKTNMVLVLPFYFFYLLKDSKAGVLNIFSAVMVFLSTVLILNYPYLDSYGFLKMVYDNPVQRQIFDLYYEFNSELKIYFIPAVYFLLLLYYLNFKFVNRDQLILFLAFTFLALTLLIAPMQGWYYWILPLLVYFIIKQNKKEKVVFALLSLLYFLYFGLIDNSDYFHAFNFVENQFSFPILNTENHVLNIVFTLLQTTLLLIGYLVFKNGIKNNIQTKFLSQPYLIGIGGDSASGKSTLSNALSDVFESYNTSIIRGDDMHKWERGNENWNNYTHLDPKANKLHEDFEQARELKSGNAVQRRYYDHNTGQFTLPQFIKPNKLIVFEGLHSFYLNNQSNVYDLKIFMEPDENLRMWWKINRDVKARGYSKEKVLEQLKNREEDAQKYIRSQVNQADIVANFYALNDLEVMDQNKVPIIALKMKFPKEIYVDTILEQLNNEETLNIQHKYDGDFQILDISGNISEEKVEWIAIKAIPELDEIGIYNCKWRSDFEGILQLFTCFIVFNTLSSKKTND
jgi:uridine kinase